MDASLQNAMLTPKEIKEIFAHIKRDKKYALDVRELALSIVSRGIVYPGEPGSGLDAFLSYKRETIGSVSSLLRDDNPFYAKVETTNLKTNKPYNYLITKHRVGASLVGDDWVVCAWTTGVIPLISDCKLNSPITYSPQNLMVSVNSRAKYGVILPLVQDTTYETLIGTFYVELEKLLDSKLSEDLVLRQAPPEKEYEAKQEFGLDEIISITDATQKGTMQLPFKNSVLIEGPPGSGKTTVGLMRIPCLIDTQWEELGIDPETNSPFHKNESTRVLVTNDEMIDYLSRLVRSIGLLGVPITTTGNFCKSICRDAGILRGRQIKETVQLAQLKSNLQILDHYWAALRSSTIDTWERFKDQIITHIESVGKEFGQDLVDNLENWIGNVKNHVDLSESAENSINLAFHLEKWRTKLESIIDFEEKESKKRSEFAKERKILTSIAKRITRMLIKRRRIVNALIESGEFQKLCDTLFDENTKNAILEEWRSQTNKRTQSLSIADFAIGAWLSTYIATVPTNTKGQIIGLATPHLTHVLFDEAQDISPIHIAAIRRLVDKEGTITLVGDLRQRITDNVLFDTWDDLGIGKLIKANFEINYRQSKPLGQFIRALHLRLYSETPGWNSSSRRGELPRVCRIETLDALANTAAKEVKHWRKCIPKATVGILYHGEGWNGIDQFAEELEELLSDTLTDVHVTQTKGHALLAYTDCVIISSVAETKGLEFDVVLVIDPLNKWNEIRNTSLIDLNALYVGSSRAKQGLSIIINSDSTVLDELRTDTYERL